MLLKVPSSFCGLCSAMASFMAAFSAVYPHIILTVLVALTALHREMTATATVFLTMRSMNETVPEEKPYHNIVDRDASIYYENKTLNIAQTALVYSGINNTVHYTIVDLVGAQLEDNKMLRMITHNVTFTASPTKCALEMTFSKEDCPSSSEKGPSKQFDIDIIERHHNIKFKWHFCAQPV
ncbi:uncharacterized protein LOC144134806 isoform X2 [Amblyomma americanum]